MYVETVKQEVYPELYELLLLLGGVGKWCIAGGAGRNYLERLNLLSENKFNEAVIGDFDLFVLDKSEFYKLVNLFTANGFEVKYTAEQYLMKFKKGNTKVDVIYNSEYQTPKDVVDSFDFRCCQVYITPDKVITADDTVLADIHAKGLNLVSMRRPYGILRRIQSYAKKGYMITEHFAECFVDAIRILDEEDLDLSFSYSDQESFSWQNYDEEAQAGGVVSTTQQHPTRAGMDQLSIPSFWSTPEGQQIMLDLSATTEASQRSSLATQTSTQSPSYLTGTSTNGDRPYNEYLI